MTRIYKRNFGSTLVAGEFVANETVSYLDMTVEQFEAFLATLYPDWQAFQEWRVTRW